MRSFLTILLSITLVLLLTSCNTKKDALLDSSKNPNSSALESVVEKTDSKKENANNKIPTEKDISEDLVENGMNRFELNYSVENLNIASLEIDKRKTDSVTDVIYVSAVFKNTYYKVEADLILYYSFYTEGGWLLDNCETANYQSFANCPYYTDKDFIEFLEGSCDKGKIKNRNHGTDSSGVYYDNITFSGVINDNYLTTTITGKYSMFFVDDVWHSEIIFNDINYDWSKVLGTWKYTHENGDYITFKIDNIDEKNETFSYSYYTSPWKWVDVLYGQKHLDFTDSKANSKIHYTTKICYFLGKEIEMPEYFSVSVSLGGKDWGDGKSHVTSTGVHGIFINKDYGLKLIAKTYNDERTKQITLSFPLNKIK